MRRSRLSNPLTYEDIKNKVPVKQGVELGIEGDNYLVGISEEKIYSLSLSAFYVWQLCDGSRNVEELATHIMQDLKESSQEISESELKEVLTLILGQLHEAELIKFSEE
ncbi:MAG: PqqD family protein [Desulfurococcaceae archaeon]|nr:PqqD family protein [Desulfurococcaceae archaeon]